MEVALRSLSPCCPQALQCCDEGAYLLANQQMDKCQSKEGAQKALQDIERFLESSSTYLNYDPQALYYDFESVLTPELKVSQAPVPCHTGEKQGWAVAVLSPSESPAGSECRSAGICVSCPSVPGAGRAAEAGERPQPVREPPVLLQEAAGQTRETRPAGGPEAREPPQIQVTLVLPQTR